MGRSQMFNAGMANGAIGLGIAQQATGSGFHRHCKPTLLQLLLQFLGNATGGGLIVVENDADFWHRGEILGSQGTGSGKIE